jgi:hypothetical protein
MVQRFSRTQNKKHGPTINDFRLDFTGSGLASAWNKHAAVLFSERFLSLNKYSCRDEDLIRNPTQGAIQEFCQWPGKGRRIT